MLPTWAQDRSRLKKKGGVLKNFAENAHTIKELLAGRVPHRSHATPYETNTCPKVAGVGRSAHLAGCLTSFYQKLHSTGQERTAYLQELFS